MSDISLNWKQISLLEQMLAARLASSEQDFAVHGESLRKDDDVLYQAIVDQLRDARELYEQVAKMADSNSPGATLVFRPSYWARSSWPGTVIQPRDPNHS